MIYAHRALSHLKRTISALHAAVNAKYVQDQITQKSVLYAIQVSLDLIMVVGKNVQMAIGEIGRTTSANVSESLSLKIIECNEACTKCDGPLSS